MLSTRLSFISTAAIALCHAAAAQNGAVAGTATIGAMEDTFTIPFDEWDGTSPPECTSVMAGCTGEFVTLEHETGGTITVLDDCTFRISQYTFDGEGPAVEWWASKQDGSPALFPYPENAIKIAELGEEGNYQAGMNVPGGSGEVVVRLGMDADGTQLLLSPDLDHISLWCEDYTIDFGNAALECDSAGPAAAPGPADMGPLPAPVVAVPPGIADAPGPADDADTPALAVGAPEAATPAAVADVPAADVPAAEAPADVPIDIEPAMAPPAPPVSTGVDGPADDDDVVVGVEEGAGAAEDEAAAAEGGSPEADAEAVEAGAAMGAARLVSACTLAAGAAVLLM